MCTYNLIVSQVFQRAKFPTKIISSLWDLVNWKNNNKTIDVRLMRLEGLAGRVFGALSLDNPNLIGTMSRYPPLLCGIYTPSSVRTVSIQHPPHSPRQNHPLVARNLFNRVARWCRAYTKMPPEKLTPLDKQALTRPRGVALSVKIIN